MSEHTSLAAGRWQTLSLVEQLANIGSEVERAISWQDRGNAAYSAKACGRALELLELTLSSPLPEARLRELARVHEAIADYFAGENKFASTPALWHSYFGAFTYAAQVRRSA